MNTKSQLLKSLIREEVRKQLGSKRLTEVKTASIELSNAYVLSGPAKNLDKAGILAKQIEAAMEAAMEDAGDMGMGGSEDAAMDAASDAMYEFESQIRKIGWKLDI